MLCRSALETFDHDPRFKLMLIGEIAARSLSAAVNDPGTTFDVMATALNVLGNWSRARNERDAKGGADFDHVTARAVRELAQRLRATDGTDLARALDYSLKRWAALTRYIDDGQLPIDNNWVESQIRPIALGRSNWLFAGSLRAGQRAAAVMSLIQLAKLNGLDPHVYVKDVLQRLPTHKALNVGELLPH